MSAALRRDITPIMEAVQAYSHGKSVIDGSRCGLRLMLQLVMDVVSELALGETG